MALVRAPVVTAVRHQGSGVLGLVDGVLDIAQAILDLAQLVAWQAQLHDQSEALTR